MRALRYEVWDVFTRERLTGNQLAVFWDAGGMAPEEMTAIAREMNYSESTFVADGRVRIFLRTGEIAFAGHPVLGTAFAMHARRPAPVIEVKLKDSVVAVEFSGDEAAMLQPEPELLERYDPAAAARWIGLPKVAVTDQPPVQTVSTGRPNILVMLGAVEDLGRVRVDWPAIDAEAEKDRGIYVMAAAGPGRYRARKMLRDGEDPVTGSAGGAAIAWLVEHGVVQSGERTRIEQGIEMKRPGWMTVSAERTGGKVTEVRVGGCAVKTAEGVLTYDRRAFNPATR